MRRQERRRFLHGSRRALSLAVAALLCAGVCLSCSDDASVEVTTQCLAFLPSEGTAEGHVIARTGAESTCNELDIELVATSIEGINAADIEISYPNGLTIVTLAQVGPLLLGGSESVVCASALADYDVDCVFTDDFNNGTLNLSITRTQNTTGPVDANAEGEVLAVLTFLQITTLSGAQGPFGYNIGKLLDDGNGGSTGPAAIIDVNVDPSTFVGGQMIIETR